jgi:hypothetical protein
MPWSSSFFAKSALLASFHENILIFAHQYVATTITNKRALYFPQQF